MDPNRRSTVGTWSVADIYRTVFAALVALIVFPPAAAAQPPSVYLGGAFNMVTQTHSVPAEPLGGTTRGASIVLGVQVSQRLSVEFEPTFEGTCTGTFTFRDGAGGRVTF